jgi:hypothetical protein
MGQPQKRLESVADHCFACAGAISAADLSVYLYGVWFHLPCYQRENNLPNEEPAVMPGARGVPETPWAVKRLIAWITDASPRAPSRKDPVAVELGRRGGLKGGKARAAKLSPAQRAAIARRAARARWGATKER